MIATLACKADPNAYNSHHITPLFMTIWKGFLHLAAILLQAKADPNIPDQIFFLIFLSIPLVFAIRRRDPRAVRLLLDFGANPNVVAPDINYKRDSPKTNESPVQLSLLSIAAQSGFYEGIKMLLDKGAKLENGNEHPFLTALSRGNRECFIALIDGREEMVLDSFQDHSLAYYAIQYDTTLLPLLASLMKREHEKILAKNSQYNVSFPPCDLNSKDRKKFETALKYEDLYLPYDIVRKTARQCLCPWHIILDDKPIENETQDDDISKEDHYDNTVFLTSQMISANAIDIPNTKQSDYNNNEGNSISKSNNHSKSSKTSKTSKTSRTSKTGYSNNYYDNDEPEAELSTHSESEDVSDHLTFSALDDEDEVLKTNSDPFKGRAPDWVPLAQRRQRNQTSSHKTQRSSAYESDKKTNSKREEDSFTNDYDELSEPTYEQSEIVRTDEAAAGDFINEINNDVSDNYYNDYDPYGYEEEEEEESFYDE